MTEFNSFLKLIEVIFDEIKQRNKSVSTDAIPLSNEFYNYLAKKYKLIPHNIPTLIKILSNSKKIIVFPVFDEDQQKNIPQINGFVITKGDVIKKLKLHYEDLFVQLYTDEFHKKMPIEKIILDFPSKRHEYFNTPIGNVAGIAIMLGHVQGVFERNILDYSEKNQEKLLNIELDSNYSLSEFVENIIDDDEISVSGNKNTKSAPQQKRRAVDSANYKDFKANVNNSSIEKTLKTYGIEFYTRVCFRDYQFNLIDKLIEEGFITKKNDLLNIKRLLELERKNADQDVKIHEFAADINSLMKIINQKLKSS